MNNLVSVNTPLQSKKSRLNQDESQIFLSWGWKVVNNMRYDEIRFFLELGGAVFRNEFIPIVQNHLKFIARWGFICVIHNLFNSQDWIIFLKLLDLLSESQLIDIAAKIHK
ncbi:hypothetical protein [Candidatus Harpocratesius sp.]